MSISLPWRVKPHPFDAHRSINTSLLDEEVDALGELVSHHGTSVLEIGSAYGYSTLSMVKQGATVMAVDPHGVGNPSGAMPHSLAVFLANVEGHPEVIPVIAPSAFAMTMLNAMGARFDVIFIDGDHAVDAVKGDMGWAKWLVRSGGAVACHDYNEATCPGVKLALDEMYPEGPDRLAGTLWIREADHVR